MTRRLLLLASDKAGGADDDTLATVAEVLSKNFEVQTAMTSSAEELDAALAELDGRILVIAGGDGSLHAVVAALFRRGELADADLALVPLGTGNDFAQTAGIPPGAVDAASIIADAVRRPFDLIVDDRAEVAVNVVHAGVGADAADRATALKPALGVAAYPVGAMVAAATSSGWNVTVEADGVLVHDDAAVFMVAVANGRTIGGGTAVCPVADPSDGLLDLVIVTAVGVTARVGFGADLRKSEHFDRDDVTHVRARTVTIRGDSLSYNADGEVGEPVASRVFSVLPSSWTLRVAKPPEFAPLEPE
ncbi:MAG: YegS/Rv2252/BmrU family lipid kinase [Mycobacteriales bacterium]